MTSDILIIGAGVTGCAVARVLSRYRADVLVLEAGCDAASGASRANSGIIHAGFDAVPGTEKARLNVLGASMWPSLAKELSVPYRKNGALVLAFSGEENRTLRMLFERGRSNGVPELSLLSREEALALEPNLNPEIAGALLAPSSAVTSPYEMTYALADHAAVNGVSFRFDSPVTAISREGDGLWRVETPLPCAFRLQDGKLTQWDGEKGEVLTISAAKLPWLKLLQERLAQWLSGDLPALRKEAAVALVAANRVRLTPNGGVLALIAAAVEIEFSDDLSRVTQIRLEEKSGDRLTIRFRNTILNQPIPATAWELQ